MGDRSKTTQVQERQNILCDCYISFIGSESQVHTKEGITGLNMFSEHVCSERFIS